MPIVRKPNKIIGEHTEPREEPKAMGLFGKKQSPLLTVLDQEHGRTLVTVDKAGHVELHVNSADEAKVAIQLLKLKKKELALAKRQLTTRQQQVRTQHTDWVRRHGPGSGLFSQRTTWSRGHERKHLAENLAPLEQVKATLDANAFAVERAMLRLEEYALTHAASRAGPPTRKQGHYTKLVRTDRMLSGIVVRACGVLL